MAGALTGGLLALGWASVPDTAGKIGENLKKSKLGKYTIIFTVLWEVLPDWYTVESIPIARLIKIAELLLQN